MATPFRDDDEGRAGRPQDAEGPRTDPKEPNKVLTLTTSFQRMIDPAASPNEPLARRELSAALELVHEASEAIRIAEETNQELEARAQDMAQRYRDDLQRAQAQITLLEQRLRESERRATDAEEWLERFRQTIVGAFGRRNP